MKQAFDFMVDLEQRYKTGETPRKQIKALRAELAKVAGIPLHKKHSRGVVFLKRPASSSAPSTPVHKASRVPVTIDREADELPEHLFLEDEARPWAF